MKSFAILALSLVSAVIVGISTPNLAHATTSGFQAGRIMDDGVMTNDSSMSVSQIQNFLNSKVPSCDTNGEKLSEYGGPDLNGDGKVQRWEWGKAKYNQTKFMCLKDYTVDGKKASQLILEKSNKYDINPQSLIVLLQKEQGLVTDTWPLNIQYRTATGYGCPDTAPCDSQYYGLANQLDWAAKMFRSIINQDPNWYSPYFKGSNPTVYWHPNTSSCGSQSLSIQNWTTASLYSYTPYRPNQAALDAGWGTGNSCSSYGNRNFYAYFNSWFGSTLSDAYTAQFKAQSPSTTIAPGNSYQAYVEYTNSGAATWYDQTAISNGTAPSGAAPARLATSNPMNRTSAFGATWGGKQNRPALEFSVVYKSDGTPYSTNPHMVKPGESARFTFTMSAPSQTAAGTYKEYFNPIVEGVATMKASTVYLVVNVDEVYSTSFKGQSPYPTIKPGASANAFLTYANTGNVAWYDKVSIGAGKAPSGTKPVRLATTSPTNRTSQFGSSWGGSQNRATDVFATVYKKDGSAYSTNPHIVKPGEAVRFAFKLTVPDAFTAGTYRENFAPVVEGKGIIPVTTFLDVIVPSAQTTKATVSSVSQQMNPLQERTLQIGVKNTGNVTLSGSDLVLTASGDTEKLKHSSWLSDSDVSRLNEASLPPGETGSFDLTVLTPQQGGTFKLQLSTTTTGGSTISLSSTSATFNVAKPTHTAGFAGQSGYPTLRQNSNANVFIRFKNTGNTAWYDAVSRTSSIKPVVLASTNTINRISSLNAAFASKARPTVTFSRVLKSDGVTLAANQHIAQPGEIAEFAFTFNAPDNLKPAIYREWFQPILEGSREWNMKGKAFLDVRVLGGTNVAKFRGQSGYPTINRGENANVHFLYENAGTATWYDNDRPKGIKPVRLATAEPINRQSKFTSSNRPAVVFDAVFESDGTTPASNQNVVRPGQVVRLAFTMNAPSNLAPGVYREWFRPILESGRPWDMGSRAFLDVTVR